jgi:glutamate-1-semialdehyde 2,1-aminomutase
VSELCTANGALLIFDEVLTGLRVARGGAQALYGIKPDLTCLGKALGGGMPVGAYGGSREIMDHLLPVGDVYQAGTFSGNPATMSAVVEILQLLTGDVYAVLEERTDQLFEGLSRQARLHSRTVQLQRVGSMFGIMFAEHAVQNFQDHLGIDAESFARFFHLLLHRGVYLPPSAVDAACLSSAHSAQDIEDTIEACGQAFSLM